LVTVAVKLVVEPAEGAWLSRVQPRLTYWVPLTAAGSVTVLVITAPWL